jgi:nucleoside-diphosphate-sugar epimerase
MSTSLVTGGAGFIGSHLVDALLDRGDTVRVLDDLSSGNISNIDHCLAQIDFINGDIRNPDDLKKALKGVDLVFHQAAFVSVPLSLQDPESCLDVNVQGTQKVLEYSRQAGVKRVVLASSAAVYGEIADFPLMETGRLNPLSPYATSKYINEVLSSMYTDQFGLEVVALRYFNVYGPRQDPKSDYAAVIPIFIENLLSDDTPVIFGDGNQSRDFVYVSDVVRANLLAGQSNDAPGRVINICGGKDIGVNDILKTLSSILMREIEPIYESPREGDIYRSVGDPSHAREIIDFEPQTGLRSGLEMTINWMRGSV